MDTKQLKHVIEAALLAAGRPLSLDKLQSVFGTNESESPARQDLRAAVMELKADYTDRGIELVEVGSGFRIQIKTSMAHQLERLWEERPPRYSRALLETLAIVAYRQPVTRGEIEDIRGVAVSTNIVRTLLERSWIKVVGHRDVPGKPAMFGTTKEFLDYFGLKKLDDLPPLSELKDFDKLNIQLDLPGSDAPPGTGDEVVEPALGEFGLNEGDVQGDPEASSQDADTGEDAVDESSEAESDSNSGVVVDILAADEIADDDEEEVHGTDNIASLAEARVAAQLESSVDPDEGRDAEEVPVDDLPATVLPLKQP